jgi:NSS family neurotransmitter:Na+ symporter
LLISGALFAAGTMARGVVSLRREVNQTSDGWRLGRWFDVLIVGVIPVSILAMLGWWFYQASVWDPDGWLNPLKPNSVGTCLVQWGLVVALLIVFNRWLFLRYRSCSGQRVGEE